ncbi:MAG: undecaprenyl-phosphate galactose phosphotransferase WbaP [Spirochaetaceae bacterium]|jgi:Undecaprenyl-phosphate galactose phosphotransferase WbaP|nr:undecaprenyl-phosphate galactose phosphotransferase WbaP [Spirochaetaceae bacterium]
MDLAQFDTWYRIRYHNTSSFLIGCTIIISDLVGAMLSFGAGFFMVNLYDLSAINFRSFVTYWPYLPVFVLLFWMFRLYPGISLAPAEELRHIGTASFIAHGGIIFSRYIEDKEFDAISVAFIISFIFSMVIFLLCRSITHMLLRRARIRGIPAVVYGSGNFGRQMIDQILENSRVGYVPAVILDSTPESGDAYQGIPILHDLSLGPELIKKYKIKMAIIATSEFSQKELTRLLNFSLSAFRYSVLVPDFVSITNIWMSVRDFHGLLGFAAANKLRMGWNLVFKRAFDISIVILGGVVIFPFLLIIALLIKLGSRGPALYKHARLGKNGKSIMVYKFRSMVTDADKKLREMLSENENLRKEWEEGYKLKNDPRITPIGRWIRKTSIDEFPQILNVLKGEMSLVGPRPVTAGEAEKYGEHFGRIFSIKPGMTGLWQVSGRSDTDYNERISYDSYYLQSWSVWLDLWILYKTVGVVLRGKGAY